MVKQKSSKNLGALDTIFATQYISQWLDKTGVRKAIEPLKADEVLTAKKLRAFLSEHYLEFGWDKKELRRWKLAAVLILRQL